MRVLEEVSGVATGFSYFSTLCYFGGGVAGCWVVSGSDSGTG